MQEECSIFFWKSTFFFSGSMNLFFLDSNPEQAAKALCNKHVVKMLLEAVQVLYTVHSIYKTNFDSSLLKPYKPTHTGHPVVVWASMARAHFYWVLSHAQALVGEYGRRYPQSTPHKCVQHVWRLARRRAPIDMPSSATVADIQERLTDRTTIGTSTAPRYCAAAPLCFGGQSQCVSGSPIDVVQSYRAYYKWKESRMQMTWAICKKKRNKTSRPGEDKSGGK